MSTVVSRAISALPNPVLSRLSGEHLVAPCFHLVTEGDAPAHVRHLLQCPTSRQFVDDLDVLLKGRTPISLDQLHRAVNHGVPLPPRALFLSFDDGMREMAEVVAPILHQKGIPATFFLTTDFLDNQSLFFRHKASVLLDYVEKDHSGALNKKLQSFIETHGTSSLDARKFVLGIKYRDAWMLVDIAQTLGVDFAEYLSETRPYLTTAQVNDLLRQGFSIGAHSVDHPLYKDLTLREQIRQTVESVEFLQRRFRIDVRAFAFPFVSDGVESHYFDALIDRIDLFMCIGRMAYDSSAKKLVQRFGVESESNASAVAAWREYAGIRTKTRLRNSVFGES